MTIDLTNYEEYFLLYADNELSAKDKLLVDLFVENHPELKEEFEAILQTVLSIDEDTKLNNKSFLYRNDGFINTSNYEEILVQYFDNELNEDEVAATEHFLAQHPQFNKEADFIKRTKVLPDTLIVFPDKELLYKKAERIKVVPIIWLRLAAAAVFLGFGFWFGSSYLNKPTVVNPSSVVNTTEEQQAVSPVQKPVIVGIPDTLTQQKKPEQLAVTMPDHKEKKESLPTKKILNPASQLPATIDVAITKAKVSTIKNMKTTSTKPVDEDLATVDKDVRSTFIEQLNKGNDVAIATGKDHNDEIINTKPKDNYTRRTAFTEEQNPDYIFNMPEDKFNKTKVGSFLKKVKRNIERRLPFNGPKD
jgi:hypothetical protein